MSSANPAPSRTDQVDALYVGGDLDFSACKEAMQSIAVALVGKPKTVRALNEMVSATLVNKSQLAQVAYARFLARFASFRAPVTWKAVEDFLEDLPHKNDAKTVNESDLPIALRAVIVGVKDDVIALLNNEPSNGVGDLGFRLFAYILHFMLQDEKLDFVRTFVAGSVPLYLLKRLHVMVMQFP